MDIMSLYTKGYEILNQDTIKIFKFTPENIDILHNQTNITKIVLYQYDYEEDPLSINLPDTIKSIDFKDSCAFNQQLFKLPRDLEVLILHEEYDYPLPNPLPVNLKYLDLGYRFNHQILELPNNLTCLIMSNDYTQDLPIFPDTLTKLVIGNDFSDFNKSILSLPSSLLEFKIGDTYGCYPLPEPLPPNLQKLTLGKEYNHPLSNNLPDTLQELYLPIHYNQRLPDSMPINLKHLSIGCLYSYELDNLPQGLDILSIIGIARGGNYNYDGVYHYHGILSNLPNTLKNLQIYNDVNNSLDMLPESIEKLSIRHYTRKINKLPLNLKDIMVNKDYKYVDDLKLLKPIEDYEKIKDLDI